MLVLDMAARLQAPLTVRYACLCHDLGKATTSPDDLPRHPGHELRSVDLLRAMSQRLRVPTHCRELAEVVAREHGVIHGSLSLSAEETVLLLERCDAFRQPKRFEEVLLACECDFRGRESFENTIYPQRQHMLQALHLLLELDEGATAQAISAQWAQSQGTRQGKEPLGLLIRSSIRNQRTSSLQKIGYT